MKNLVIPAILAATVLVAGMFAYMPIEKASTVHSTILTKQANVNKGDDVANAAIIDIVADSAKIKSGFVCVLLVDTGGNNAGTVQFETTDDNEAGQLIPNTNIEVSPQCAEFTGFRVFIPANGAGDTADFVAMWKEEQ